MDILLRIRYSKAENVPSYQLRYSYKKIINKVFPRHTLDELRPAMWCDRYCLTRKWIALVSLLIWTVCAIGCATPSSNPTVIEEEDVQESTPPTLHILRDIQVVDTVVHIDLTRSGTKDIYYSAFRAIDPLRLVLDLPDTVSKGAPTLLAVENEIIHKIETVTMGSESEPFTRIEISLNQETGYLIDAAQERIWVTFFADKGLMESAAAQGEPVVHPEVEESPTETTLVEIPDDTTPTSEEEESEVPPPPVEEERLPPASKILEIQPVTMVDGLNVRIIGDGSLEKYLVFMLNRPPRLVVDLFEVRSSAIRNALVLNGTLVKKIRVGLHVGKVRVVFDLVIKPEGEPSFEVTLEKNLLVVSFLPRSDNLSQ